MLCKSFLRISCMHLLMALVCCFSSLEAGQYQISSLDHFFSTFFYPCFASGLIAVCLRPFFILPMSRCLNTSNKRIFRKHSFSLSHKNTPSRDLFSFYSLEWTSFLNLGILIQKWWAQSSEPKWYIWPQMLNI